MLHDGQKFPRILNDDLRFVRSQRLRLHTFSTYLPSLWNAAILCVSHNPALQRIVLGDGREPMDPYTYLGGAGEAGSPAAIVGTGIFLMEARKHARLGELIRAGT